MRQIAYNKHMIKETRTLNKYTKDTLGLSSKEYAKAIGTPYRTVADAWHSEKGRDHIINQVFKMYAEIKTPATVKRFNEL